MVNEKLWKRLSQATAFCLTLLLLFGLLVWDMRKAHMMSVVIHDDHVGHWKHLNDTMMRKWYSPLDLCMLKIDSPDVDLMTYRSKNCSKLMGASGNEQIRLSCNIGSSIAGKACPPPLNSRRFYGSALKDKVLGDPSNNLLKTTLRQLAALGKPVIFVGDGLSKQNQEALLCEIMRTDRVIVGGRHSPLEANYTIRWRNSRLRLDIMYMRLTNLYSRSESPKRARMRRRSSIREENKKKMSFYATGTRTNLAITNSSSDGGGGGGSLRSGLTSLSHSGDRLRTQFGVLQNATRSMFNPRKWKLRSSNGTITTPSVGLNGRGIGTNRTSSAIGGGRVQPGRMKKSSKPNTIKYSSNSISSSSGGNRKRPSSAAAAAAAETQQQQKKKRRSPATLEQQQKHKQKQRDKSGRRQLLGNNKSGDRDLVPSSTASALGPSKISTDGAKTSIDKSNSKNSNSNSTNGASSKDDNGSSDKNKKSNSNNKNSSASNAGNTRSNNNNINNNSSSSTSNRAVPKKAPRGGGHNYNQGGGNTTEGIFDSASLTLEKVKERVHGLIEERHGVVLVVNVGVWYNSREQFRHELPDILGWMNHLSKERNSSVFFRETAAQHWNHTESGYYNLPLKRYNNGTCVHIADATPEFDWRNTDVSHLIENGGHSHIHIIPFRDITLPLYNMHPTSPVHEDCTHYCFFPPMWQGVWRDLYHGVFTGNHSSSSSVSVARRFLGSL